MNKYKFNVDDYIGFGDGYALANRSREAAENICKVRNLGIIKSWHIHGNPNVEYYKTTFGYLIEMEEVSD